MNSTITRPTAINSSSNDYTTDSGVRISCPVYIDLNNNQRKELLNACRTVAHSSETVAVPSKSGISVATTVGGLNKLESYLGCSLDILRGTLFQRGGLSADLVLKIQLATGVEIVPTKELEAALKSKATVIKAFIKDNPYG